MAHNRRQWYWHSRQNKNSITVHTLHIWINGIQEHFLKCSAILHKLCIVLGNDKDRIIPLIPPHSHFHLKQTKNRCSPVWTTNCVGMSVHHFILQQNMLMSFLCANEFIAHIAFKIMNFGEYISAMECAQLFKHATQCFCSEHIVGDTVLPLLLCNIYSVLW